MKAIESVSSQLTPHPLIGKPAPQFEANSTHGKISLQDYKGSWVVLVSHPFELSPNRRWDEPSFLLDYRKIRGMNCELIGVDIEDNMAALLWCLNAREELGFRIWFPIISDINGEIAQTYGMVTVKEGKSFHTHVFYIIDAQQTLRAAVYYDTNSPDIMDHLIELVHLLQCTDAQGIVMHEFWQNEWVLMTEDEAAHIDRTCHCKQGGDMWYF